MPSLDVFPGETERTCARDPTSGVCVGAGTEEGLPAIGPVSITQRSHDLVRIVEMFPIKCSPKVVGVSDRSQRQACLVCNIVGGI